MRRISVPVMFMLIVLVACLVSAPARALSSSIPLHANGFQPDTNGFFDGDLGINVGNASGDFFTAVRGHLKMAQKGTGCAGTFTDYFGNKTYPASATQCNATSSDGNYTINTMNGKFTFVVSNGNVTTTTVPTKYGSDAGVQYLAIRPHIVVSHAPITLDLGHSSMGPYFPHITGQLTLFTDPDNFILPYDQKNAVFSSFAYTLNGKQYLTPIAGYGEYYPINGGGSGYIRVVLKLKGATLFVAMRELDIQSTHVLTGSAYGLVGSQTYYSPASAQ